MTVVEFKDFAFSYKKDSTLLDIASLSLSGPGLIAIKGASGTGKSTLVKFIAAQKSLRYNGSLKVFGTEWREIQNSRMSGHRRRLGYIPQNYGLLPSRTVRQNLYQNLVDAGVAEKERNQRIERALQEMGIADHIDRAVELLSGGQQQRVAIAKALARHAELVVADEPTANLNEEMARAVMTALRRVGEDALVIIVTHSDLVVELSDAVLNLSEESPVPVFTVLRPSTRAISPGDVRDDHRSTSATPPSETGAASKAGALRISMGASVATGTSVSSAPPRSTPLPTLLTPKEPHKTGPLRSSAATSGRDDPSSASPSARTGALRGNLARMPAESATPPATSASSTARTGVLRGRKSTIPDDT